MDLVRGTTVLEMMIAAVPSCKALAGQMLAVLPISLAPAPAQVGAQVDARILAAWLDDPFRSTGVAALAEAARASDHLNRTLPPGRPHRVAAPFAASQPVRAACPDIRYATAI
jgi:hypothetical protein